MCLIAYSEDNLIVSLSAQHLVVCSRFSFVFVEVKSFTKLILKKTKNLFLPRFLSARYNWRGSFYATSDNSERVKTSKREKASVCSCGAHVWSGCRRFSTHDQRTPDWARLAQSSPDWTHQSEENSDFHTFCLSCGWMKILCYLSRVTGARRLRSFPSVFSFLVLIHKGRRRTGEMKYERLENERRLRLISTH